MILLLMYCRTGAPWGVGSAGMVKPAPAPAPELGPGPEEVVVVVVVGAGSGWAEAAREVGCCCWAAPPGTGVGMRAIGAAAGEGALVGVVEVGCWSWGGGGCVFGCREGWVG